MPLQCINASIYMCYFDLASYMNVVSLVLLSTISDFHYPLLTPYNYHHNLHLDIKHAQTVHHIYCIYQDLTFSFAFRIIIFIIENFPALISIYCMHTMKSNASVHTICSLLRYFVFWILVSISC